MPGVAPLPGSRPLLPAGPAFEVEPDDSGVQASRAMAFTELGEFEESALRIGLGYARELSVPAVVKTLHREVDRARFFCLVWPCSAPFQAAGSRGASPEADVPSL